MTAPAIGLALLAFAAVAWALPLFTDHAIDRRLAYGHVPKAWPTAINAAGRAAGDNHRTMILPGELFGDYIWGRTWDSVAPALARYPVAVRQAVRYADPRSAELLEEIDDTVQQARLVPGRAVVADGTHRSAAGARSERCVRRPERWSRRRHDRGRAVPSAGVREAGRDAMGRADISFRRPGARRAAPQPPGDQALQRARRPGDSCTSTHRARRRSSTAARGGSSSSRPTASCARHADVLRGRRGFESARPARRRRRAGSCSRTRTAGGWSHPPMSVRTSGPTLTARAPIPTDAATSESVPRRRRVRTDGRPATAGSRI